MAIVRRGLAAAFVFSVVALALAVSPARPQSARVGVVTTLEGSATVARLSGQGPEPLKFRDDVFTLDRLTTAPDSLLRVLLGGKALITIRERTVVTIRETPSTATVNVGQGRVSLSVLKERMRPGETVEVVTPNAVGTIRGTIVIAEVTPGADGGTSTITVLRGLIDVTQLDARTGRPVGSPTPVGTLQQVTVTGAAPIPSPQTITPEHARRLSGEFTLAPKVSSHGNPSVSNAATTAEAAHEAQELSPAVKAGSSANQKHLLHHKLPPHH